MNKKQVIKKVRKEVKLPKNFGKMKGETSSSDTQGQGYNVTLEMPNIEHCGEIDCPSCNKEAFNSGFDAGRIYEANYRELTARRNSAITIILVTLAILVVIAIYVGIK